MIDNGVKIPTWHHPHFVSATAEGWGIRYEYKRFTGDEPEPVLPADAKEAFRAALDEAAAARNADPSDHNRAVASAALSAWQAADREVRVLNTAWRVAQWCRDAVTKLREIAPTVAAYQAARKEAADTFESLHGTPDGFWQAKLLTLIEQRYTALDAAEKLDRGAAGIARMSDGLPERVLEETPSFRQLATEHGIELGGWWPDSWDAYEWVDGPEVAALKKLFAEQDQRITAVTRLFASEHRSGLES